MKPQFQPYLLYLLPFICLLLFGGVGCKSSKKVEGLKKPPSAEIPVPLETEEIRLEKKLAAMSFADSTVIKKIQILLFLNGYKPGKTDGTLKPQTEEALLNYQTEHQIPPGDRSVLTLRSLGVHLLDLEVQDIQQLLEQKGYDPGPADNIIGPMTRTAYLEFINDNGLGANGIISKEITAALLSNDPKYINQRPPDEMPATGGDAADYIAPVTTFITQITISQAKVIDVQRALMAKGYDAGSISPVQTPQFKDALFRYQVDKQLPMGGMNEETLRSLGFKED